MNSATVTVLCLLVFAALIILSFRKKLNLGLLSLGTAYLIGCFILKLSVPEIVALIPIKIVFMLVSVCLFYGYSIQNGTMKVLTTKIIYRFRKHYQIMPFVLYFLSFTLGLLGASAPAITSLMAPICILIAESMQIHYLIVVVLIGFGSAGGSLVPWGQGGLIVRGILESTIYATESTSLSLKICLNMFITGLLALLFVYFFYKAYKAKPFIIQKPESFNPAQKKTLILLCLVLCLVIIPSIISTLAPSLTLSHYAHILDIQMLSIIGASLCAILGLGNEREVITNYVPWNTIILVSGVCVLFALIQQTGIINQLPNYIEKSIPQNVIGIVLVILCGFMSFFSGAMSVVIPMILPVVVNICSKNGYSVTALASSAAIGAIITCISPFSTAGSFILSFLLRSEANDQMFARQFLLTFAVFIIPIVLSAIGFYRLLG